MKIFWNVLNKRQTEILPYLSFLKKKGFYLAGGTALSLQISHRTSLDFDLYFLARNLGLAKIIELTQKKYPPFNPYLALQALAYFDDAEKENLKERKITFFETISWNEVREFFVKELRIYKKELK